MRVGFGLFVEAKFITIGKSLQVLGAGSDRNQVVLFANSNDRSGLTVQDVGPEESVTLAGIELSRPPSIPQLFLLANHLLEVDHCLGAIVSNDIRTPDVSLSGVATLGPNGSVFTVKDSERVTFEHCYVAGKPRQSAGGTSSARTALTARSSSI